MGNKQSNIERYRLLQHQVPYMSRDKFAKEALLQFIDDLYHETTITLYVNGATGDDNYPGLAAAKPKATIQGAVNALPRDFVAAYIVTALGTYAENVVVTKPSTGTIYFCGTAATPIDTDTLGAACYDSTPAASVTGWHQMTMAGFFTVANTTEASWVRVTWAAGNYEWMKVLNRISDNIAELGGSLPAGKADADYDTLAVALVQPGTIVNPVTGPAFTIYDSPGGSTGSVVFGMMKTVGDTYGIQVVGKVSGIYAVLCSITADKAASAGFYMDEESDVGLGYLPAYPSTFNTLLGIGTQAAVPREGVYLGGGAGGYSILSSAGRTYLGTAYCKSAAVFAGGKVLLGGTGQTFESTVNFAGDAYVAAAAATVPTRCESTVTAEDFSKFDFGIFDGKTAATANQMTLTDYAKGKISGVSGISQSHVSAWLQMSRSAELDIAGVTVASALPANLAVSVLENAKLYITNFTGPTQDYGATPLIQASGPGAQLNIVAAAWKNSNAGVIEGVAALAGAHYTIGSTAGVAIVSSDDKRYAQVGCLAAKVDIDAYGAGTYLNDLPVAPAGVEHLSVLRVVA